MSEENKKDKQKCNSESELSELLSAIILKVESIRWRHNYCEDGWYSCPKAEDGCLNDAVGDDCNCGADDANNGIDEIIKMLVEAKGT
jgi:hypothetical protein